MISEKEEPDWTRIISLIHLLNMEETLVRQFKNANNIDARIELHRRFSINRQGWFRWIYAQLPMIGQSTILEVGCGNGQLWIDALDLLPKNISITLSDISSGMLRNVKKRVKDDGVNFTYACFDMQEIPYPDESFDIVIANFVLFYVKDRQKALQEVKRVLRKEGTFLCSTYGMQHMKEIELLVKEFDDRIALSEMKLYDIFGLDNGQAELSFVFDSVTKQQFDDSLLVTQVQPLADYIYSCHGNQMTYLSGKQERFEKFLQGKIGKKGLHITKDAGVFLCNK